MTHWLISLALLTVAPALHGAEPVHEFSVGPRYFQFYGDLAELETSGTGAGMAYRYCLDLYDNKVYPAVGFDTAYFKAEKDGYVSKHILAMPYLAMLVPQDDALSIGAILGIEANSWELRKKFIDDLPLHQDILFGLVIGFLTNWRFTDTQGIGGSARLHLQEYSMHSRYLELEIHYSIGF